MYLVDTNVISELRQGQGADRGVVDFFFAATNNNERCYPSIDTTICQITTSAQVLEAFPLGTMAKI